MPHLALKFQLSAIYPIAPPDIHFLLLLTGPTRCHHLASDVRFAVTLDGQTVSIVLSLGARMAHLLCPLRAPRYSAGKKKALMEGF